MIVVTIVLAAAGDFRQHHLSLMHGWLPLTIQAVAVVVLVAAIGWRTRRWRRLWLPVGNRLRRRAGSRCLLVHLVRGALRAILLRICCGSGSRCPGAPLVVLVAGWRGARWWRRGASVLGVPLCPAVRRPRAESVGRLLPHRADCVESDSPRVRCPTRPTRPPWSPCREHARSPPRASWCRSTSAPCASGFKHRGEFVYLPPAWFATNPPPPLPTLMMIGGEFNTPADWLRAGNAIKTADDFAAAIGGNAPVLVFVDSGGAFNNDTECVNGSRGNSADHLAEGRRAVHGAHLRRQRESGQLGHRRLVDGRHVRGRPDRHAPRRCSAPSRTSPATSRPTRATSSRRSSGCSAATPRRTRAFDPTTVMRQARPVRRRLGLVRHQRNGVGHQRADDGQRGQRRQRTRRPGRRRSHQRSDGGRERRCAALGAANGITCAVVAQPGKHDWPFAERAFATALPWLAGKLGTPGVPAEPLPASAPPAPTAEAAGR